MAAANGRRLRPWLVAQVDSGHFPGLVWDDAEHTAIRIPWQHAGKGGARGGACTALCQAWAEFKGRLRPGVRPDAASCKTRLRCALNKSSELQEVPERSRLEGPRPYKVYQLLTVPQKPGRQPLKRGSWQPQKEEGLSPTEQVNGDAQPHSTTASTPSPDEVPAEEPRLDTEDTSEEPPPGPLKLGIMVDSTEPLPLAQGGSCLGLQLWLGGELAWQGWLPPGEYLLGPPAPPGASPHPGMLPRLLLMPPPEALPPQAVGPGASGDPPAVGQLLAGLRPGLLVASTRRGLFLQRRRGGMRVHCRAPHAGPTAEGGALQEGELVQAFDAQRFREEVGQHHAGLGPRPEHWVTLAVGQELGPHDGPHNRTLVLQLEQAFAQQLLNGTPPALGPPCPLLT
ncbi:interferon regulatory factor 9-like [Numenius arquata]|uniref:interferon regulatory factor 9-like n=1 Tax=Numenius arquata TaxID=31919 RepID=UPI003D304A68